MEIDENEAVEYDYSKYNFDELFKDLEYLKKFYSSCMKFEDPEYSERESKLYMAGYWHGIQSFHGVVVRFLDKLKDNNVLKVEPVELNNIDSEKE